MKKIFGVQAEFNLTADEEIVHGLGYGFIIVRYRRTGFCGI